MHTYQEHQQLASLLRELAEDIESQSVKIRELAEERGSHSLSTSSFLRPSWSQLTTAFDMLAAHAQAVQDEADRLETHALVAV